MNKHVAFSIMAGVMLVLPQVTWAAGEEKNPSAAVTNPQSPVAFPPSEKCTKSSPCTNLMGEVVRIEERYWIKQPNGSETTLHVVGDTNMKTLPKVGDKIAAQVDSTGDAQAIIKIQEFPKPQMPVPEKTHEDLR